MPEWKIYTKTGDKGQTSLIGGKRVPKNHIRIEAYGTADELNAFVGLLRDHDVSDHIKEALLEIQDRVFTAESWLALDEGGDADRLPRLAESDIEFLEKEIDNMNVNLPALTSFILPGGHAAASLAHVCRCVCRRAERLIISLSETHEIDPVIIRYFNRLSDYFFVLARKIGLDHGVADTPWVPRR